MRRSNHPLTTWLDLKRLHSCRLRTLRSRTMDTRVANNPGLKNSVAVRTMTHRNLPVMARQVRATAMEICEDFGQGRKVYDLE